MRNTSTSSRVARATILLIAVVQIVLGVLFLLFPAAFPVALGLPPAPRWTDWMFATLGARALGFAYGMLVARRDLVKNASWLVAMIVVQALDWGATVFSVFAGKVTLMQVSTASVLPLLFIAALLWELSRQRAGRA
jgi:hypothetical protein